MKIKGVPLLFLLLLSPFFSYSQSLTGKVVDARHPEIPLAGAAIRVTGEQKGTVTDSSGHFSIRVTNNTGSLSVSFLGYRTLIVPVQEDKPDLTIALEPGDDQRLPEVTVSSRYYKQYATNTVSSALRLKTPLIDLSQNIQTITPEILSDQGSTNMTEGVTRNISGATRLDISNNYGPYIFMRGGQISTLRNGVDFTPVYRGPVPEDAAIIERIEFIKGPSLFMNNIGDPAGTFNILTRQATGEQKYSVQAQGGSFGLYRLSADLSGKTGTRGKLAYRLNAMGTSTNSFVRFDFLKRYLLAPVVRYKFSDKTSLSLEYMYQNMTYRIYSPTVASPDGYNTLPVDFTMTDPGLSPYKVNDHSAFLTVNHAFNANWSITVRGTLLRNYRNGYYLFARSKAEAKATVQNRNLNHDEELYRVYSQQLVVNGSAQTGPVAHRLLAGVDINQKRSYQDTKQFNTYLDEKGVTRQVFYPLDVTDPVYGMYSFPVYAVAGGIKASPQHAGIRYYSVYALDEITVLNNKLRLTMGGRYTGIRTDSHTATSDMASEDRKLTPRIGISYSILPALSVYALYDRTLKPQTGMTSDGRNVTPQQGVSWEIGVKKNWFGNRFTSSVSLYKIERSQIAQSDPANPGYFLLVGQQKAGGVDVDFMGEVVKGLNVVINYAYNDSKITDDVNTKLIGTPTGTYVRNVQNTWLNYTLPFRKLSGLSVSAGYQYLNGRFERNVTADNIGADARRVTPDYFRLDAAVGWSVNKLTINLNVNNILNEKLVGATWYSSGLYWYVPQAPLNFRLTAGYSF